ncbi:MAG: FtsX-like permease family protein [Pseudomonadales bacterium]|nr:FtsX-like permease family protein [Pseudomonadales bacterium]
MMVILPGSLTHVPFWPGPLLRRSARRYIRQHPWQTWLNFLGIMLGVMMTVSVDLANNSARRAFALSLETINGAISHQIVGGSTGVPDATFTALRTRLGIRRSAPNLSGQIRIQGEAFTLLGMDPLSEVSLARQRPGIGGNAGIGGAGLLAALEHENAVFMSRETAARLGLAQGESFQLFAGARPHQAWLAMTFAGENAAATEGLILTDIAVAQELLDRLGYLNSIDLVLSEAQLAAVQDWLPPALTLVAANERNDALLQMTTAFHTNLLAMSLLSLLVAALLIYNTVTLSVLQRQQTLGIYRSQGVSRREIFLLILGETGVLGLLASLVGIGLGLLLGRSLVGLVSRTINDLYFNVHVSSFLIEPLSLLKGLGLGVGIALVSAALPAWRATHCQPLSLQHRAVSDRRWQAYMPSLAVTGLILMAAGFLILRPQYGSLLAGFAALTLIIAGFCFLVPPLLSLFLWALLGLFGQRLRGTGRMALRGIQLGISRTGLAVAALTVALSVTVGVGVMVGSFRDTVILWLEQSLGGDIQISRPGALPGAGITPALQSQIAQMDGVAAVSGTLLRQVESVLGPVRLTVSPVPAGDNFYLKDGTAAQLAAFDRGEGVLISEPLAYQGRLKIGDSLGIHTDQGLQNFPILGIFYDYTSGIGLVGMPQRLYGQWWQGGTVSRLTVVAQTQGAAAETLLSRLRALPAMQGQRYFVSSNRQIRELTLAIFDRTFAITNVLRLLAILVAFVGVLCALMALQLERLREFALLRATGMTSAQIMQLVLVQTGLMGLCSGLLALPLGLMMSEVLIDVINRRSFGWSMQHIVPGNVLLEAVILALLAALLAGLYPALRAGRISPALALREE